MKYRKLKTFRHRSGRAIQIDRQFADANLIDQSLVERMSAKQLAWLLIQDGLAAADRALFFSRFSRVCGGVSGGLERRLPDLEN